MMFILRRISHRLYSNSFKNQVEINLCEASFCFQECPPSHRLTRGALYRLNEIVHLSLSWKNINTSYDFVYVEDLFLSCNQYASVQPVPIYKKG